MYILFGKYLKKYDVNMNNMLAHNFDVLAIIAERAYQDLDKNGVTQAGALNILKGFYRVWHT